MGLVDVFIQAGKTPHSAKIHARKVMNFKIDPVEKEALRAADDTFIYLTNRTSGLGIPVTIQAAEQAAEALTKLANNLRKFQSV